MLARRRHLPNPIFHWESFWALGGMFGCGGGACSRASEGVNVFNIAFVSKCPSQCFRRSPQACAHLVADPTSHTSRGIGGWFPRRMLLGADSRYQKHCVGDFSRACPLKLDTMEIPVLAVMLNGEMMGRFSDVTGACCEGGWFTA